MKDKASIRVEPIPGTPTDEARDARARALRFVFDCYAKKKAGERDAGDGMKGIEHDHPA